MRVVKHWVKDSVAYLYPISDVHLGSKDFDKEAEAKLGGYIKHVAETDNARITLVGDIMNCATRTTKGSPHEQLYGLQEQKAKAIELFEPVKDKIIAASEGWHEAKVDDFAGYTPTVGLCERLGVPYLGNSGVIVLGVGTMGRGEEREETPLVNYIIYQHHTTGGGSTPGGKMNRVDKLRSLVANADVYLGAHNHALGVMVAEIYVVDARTGRASPLRQVLVDCGGYVQWDGSYAERLQLPPFKRGSPRIRFDSRGKEKDVHVAI